MTLKNKEMNKLTENQKTSLGTCRECQWTNSTFWQRTKHLSWLSYQTVLVVDERKLLIMEPFKFTKKEEIQNILNHLFLIVGLSSHSQQFYCY